MRNWGCFTCHGFRIKGGNLYPIMNILRTSKSSIILGLYKILKLASIDRPLRAIAINWLNVINIWLWMFANHYKTSRSYIYLGFYYDPLGDLVIKPSFPLEFPATFGLICQHSFAYSVKCFSMPADLQPILVQTAVEPKSLLIQTHYNHTGTTPIIIIIIMIFIKHPILVVPFLKRCTYIKTRNYKKLRRKEYKRVLTGILRV